MQRSATPPHALGRNPVSKRKALSSTAALLGLSGGALGWTGLAGAAEGERSLQTLLLPDHYQILDDGTVVFALQTGEQLSLTEEQYVLLDGGLVLVVDEMAQNAMAALPVMGSLRTQLMTEVEPVRSPDGSIVEVSSTQPLWSGDGPTPRLFEQVDVQSYELAQDVATEEEDGLTIWGVARSVAVASFGLGFGPSGLEFTSADSVTFAENGTGTAYQAAATDYDGRAPEFSLGEGGDSSLFSISASGALTFNSSPDYENPLDAGGDNSYEVQIKGTYQNGKEIIKTVTVEVTNVAEGPDFNSGGSASFEENGTGTVYTAAATNEDGSAVDTFALSGGADAALFSITSAGILTFDTPPDFENPTDASSPADNDYEVEIEATGSSGLTSTQQVIISVTDVSYEPWAIVWQGFGLLRGKSGGEIESLPDLNGDGKPELLFQYEENDSVYLVWSDHAWSFKNQSYPSTGSTQLGLYYIDEASEGIQLMGDAPSSESIGHKIDTSGDLDGDGINDVLITELTATPNGSTSGAVYLIFGDYLKWAYENEEIFISLDFLYDITYGDNNDKIAGLVFKGSQEKDRFVENAFFMDLDGDSYSEIVFRQNPIQTPDYPLTHVVNGRFLKDYLKQTIVNPLEVGINKDNFYNQYVWDDSGVTKDAGFAIQWPTDDGFGHGRSTPDISGDGFDDLLIGMEEDHVSPSGYGVGNWYLLTSEFLSGITDKFDFTTPSGLNSQNGAFRITSDAGRLPGDSNAPAWYNGITLSRYGEPHVAEDIDDDGFPELVFGIEGASFNDGDGTPSAEGAAVLIWGGFINERLTDSTSGNEVLRIEDVLGDPFTTAAMPTWDDGGVTRNAGVVFKGETEEYLGSGGFSVEVGDFDGKSQNDLVIGHPWSKMHANGASAIQAGSVHVVWGEYLLSDPEPASFAELRTSADTVSIIPDSPFISNSVSDIVYGSELEVLDFDGDGYDDIVTRAENAWSKYGNAYSGGGHIISGQLLDFMRPSNPEEGTDTGLIVFEENNVPRLFDSDGDLLIS